ncbi:MAG: biotin holocarboxylase synthetase [Thelocarpon superellum]|nr:MAG: biotin holocarboxylase synthetase [Thelocarpon superellum]
MDVSRRAPVVFIQYLAALAIVEGIKTYDVGYETVPVMLKWPNDIYAADPTAPGEKKYVKIGGILVNSSFSGKEYLLVVGIGLNVNNAAPTTSLNALLPPRLAPMQVERVLARILTSFETLYVRFQHAGFSADLESRYYRHWLHTDQIITLGDDAAATVVGRGDRSGAGGSGSGGGDDGSVFRARIKGITRDWGLLLMEQLGWEDRATGRFWQLQSDGNSFDFFRGLIRRKV